MPLDDFSYPGDLRLTRAAVLRASWLSIPHRDSRIAARNPRVQCPPRTIVRPRDECRSGISAESAANARCDARRGQSSVAALEPAAIQRDKCFAIHVEYGIETEPARSAALPEHLRDLVVLRRGDLVAVTELPICHPRQLRSNHSGKTTETQMCRSTGLDSLFPGVDSGSDHLPAPFGRQIGKQPG